jgi:hypothetical protein
MRLYHSLKFFVKLSRLPHKFKAVVKIDGLEGIMLIPYTMKEAAQVWFDLVSHQYGIVSIQLWVRGDWPWQWSLEKICLPHCKNQPLLNP